MSRRRFDFLRAASIAALAITAVPPTPSPTADTRTYDVSSAPTGFALAWVPDLPPAKSAGAADVTPATFTSAWYAALPIAGGTTIRFAPGAYTLNFTLNRAFTNMVRFIPADYANPPVITFTGTVGSNQVWLASGAGNHWFDGFGWSAPNLTLDYQNGLVIELSSNFRVSRGYSQMGSDPTYAVKGLGKAFVIRGSDRVSIDGVDFRKSSYGIIVTHNQGGTTRSSNVYIGFNDFRKRTDGSTGVGLDAINLNGVTGFIIEYNQEWNKSWTWESGGGLHPDFIQFLANDPSSNWAAQFSDNGMIQFNLCMNDSTCEFLDDPGHGMFSQHFFMSDGIHDSQKPTSSPFPYSKIILQYNDFMGTGNWAGRFESCQGALVRGNRFKKSSSPKYFDFFGNALQTILGSIAGATFQQPPVDQIRVVGNSASSYVVGADTTGYVDGGGNVTDTHGYSDAEMHAVRTPWLSVRDAIYAY